MEKFVGIKSIKVSNFLNTGKKLYWELASDVNVLEGLNGSGKTLLLQSVAKKLFDIHGIYHFSKPIPPIGYLELDLSEDGFSKVFRVWEPHTRYIDNFHPMIRLGDGSSGENKYNEIIRTVTLDKSEPMILIVDDIDSHLHIEVQEKLLSEIRAINPNCQVICSTHSTSMFIEDWADKFVRLYELLQ